MKRKLTVLIAVLLLAALPCLLCGCVAGLPELAFRKMEKAGFDVLLVSSSMVDDFLDFSSAPAKIHDIDTMLIVGDVLSGEMQFIAVYFKNKDAAKDAYDFFEPGARETGAIVRMKNKCVYFIEDNSGLAALKAFET